MLETVHDNEDLPDVRYCESSLFCYKKRDVHCLSVLQLSLQIGINSGTVVESILGRKLLPRWKLFGDTVNTASRMKTTGMTGQVHVSRYVRSLMMHDAIRYIATFDPEAALDWCEKNNYPKEDLHIAEDIVAGYEGFKKTYPQHDSNVLTGIDERSHTSSQSDVPLSLGDLCLGELVGFYFEPRGKVNIKGKGSMYTYWVKVFDDTMNSEHDMSTPHGLSEIESHFEDSQHMFTPDNASTDEGHGGWNQSMRSLRINNFEDIQGIAPGPHNSTSRSRNTGTSFNSYASMVPASLKISISPAQLQAQRARLFPNHALRHQPQKAKFVGKEMQEKFVAPRQNQDTSQRKSMEVLPVNLEDNHDMEDFANDTDTKREKYLSEEKAKMLHLSKDLNEDNRNQSIPVKRKQVVPFVAINRANEDYLRKKEKISRTAVGAGWDTYACKSRRRLLDAGNLDLGSDNDDDSIDSSSTVEENLNKPDHPKTNTLISQRKLFGSVYSFFEHSKNKALPKPALKSVEKSAPDIEDNRLSQRRKQKLTIEKGNVDITQKPKIDMLSKSFALHSKSMGRLPLSQLETLGEKQESSSSWLATLPGQSGEDTNLVRQKLQPSQMRQKAPSLKHQKQYRVEGSSMRDLRRKNISRRRLSNISQADATTTLIGDMLSSKRRIIKQDSSAALVLQDDDSYSISSQRLEAHDKGAKTKDDSSKPCGPETEPENDNKRNSNGDSAGNNVTRNLEVKAPPQDWEMRQVGYNSDPEETEMAGKGIKLTQAIRNHSVSRSPKKRDSEGTTSPVTTQKARIRSDFTSHLNGRQPRTFARRFSAPSEHESNNIGYEIRHQISSGSQRLNSVLLRNALSHQVSSERNVHANDEDSTDKDDETDDDNASDSTRSNSVIFHKAPEQDDYGRNGEEIKNIKTGPLRREESYKTKTLEMKNLLKSKQSSAQITTDPSTRFEVGEDFAHASLAFRKKEATTAPLNTSRPSDSLFSDSVSGMKYNPVDRLVRYQSQLDNIQPPQRRSLTSGRRRSSAISLSNQEQQELQDDLSVSSSDVERDINGHRGQPKTNSGVPSGNFEVRRPISRITHDVPSHDIVNVNHQNPSSNGDKTKLDGANPNNTDLPRPQLRPLSLQFMEDAGSLESKYQSAMLETSSNLFLSGLTIFASSSLFILLASINDIHAFTILRIIVLVACSLAVLIAKLGKAPVLAWHGAPGKLAFPTIEIRDVRQKFIKRLSIVTVTFGIFIHYLHTFVTGVLDESIEGIDSKLRDQRQDPSSTQEDEAADSFAMYHSVVYQFSTVMLLPSFFLLRFRDFVPLSSVLTTLFVVSESTLRSQLWGWGIGWIVANTVLAFALVRLQEMQQRYDFYLHYVAEEGRKVTTKMLHAMLPPTIAEKMLSNEGRQETEDKLNSTGEEGEESQMYSFLTTRSEGENSLLYHHGTATEPVSLLMFDLVGFTKMSASIGPHALVSMLDRLYNAFDKIVEKRGAHKVETIGDAFLVCSGAPDPKPPEESAKTIAKCALDMLQTVCTFVAPKGHMLEARIGIHIGNVLGGVIGSKMPRYQLFGTAVDKTMDLEASSIPGFVHASKEILLYLRRQPDLRVVEVLDDGSGYIQKDKKGSLQQAW